MYVWSYRKVTLDVYEEVDDVLYSDNFEMGDLTDRILE